MQIMVINIPREHLAQIALYYFNVLFFDMVGN